MLLDEFSTRVGSMIASIVKSERDQILRAGELVAKVVRSGGVLHTFGAGHSATLAKELVGRAGGFVPVNQIVDGSDGAAERVPGYAEVLLAAYDSQYGLLADEAVIVVSNSGVNPLPIEVAIGCAERGLAVIGLTNLKQSKGSVSRHSSGRRLYELCDVVLDNHGAHGDALIAVGGGEIKTGAGSTIAGAFILHSVMVHAAELLEQMGAPPPILRSRNLPDTDALNSSLLGRYAARLRRPGA